MPDEKDEFTLEDALDKAEGGRYPRYKHREEVLIATILHSATIEDAAEKCGVSSRWVRKCMKNPRFLAKFQEAKQMLLANAILNLQTKVGKVVEKLYDFLMDENFPPAQRVQAASILIKHGVQMIQSENDQRLRDEIKAFIREIDTKRSQVQGAKSNLLALAEQAEVVETDFREVEDTG